MKHPARKLAESIFDGTHGMDDAALKAIDTLLRGETLTPPKSVNDKRRAGKDDRKEGLSEG